MARNSYFNENTLEELLEEIKYVYQSDKRPWVIGYSGGKDSTTVVELVYKMLQMLPKEERNKNVYIVSSDTLIENPLIKIYLSKMNKLLGEAAKKDDLPIISTMVTPPADNSFWANVIGRGFPTPRINGTFRWCTDRLKINPSANYIRNVIKKEGEEVVVLLGVRKAESEARRRRIEGRELANRLMNRHETIQDAYVYNPIVELTTEDVWDVLLRLDGGKTPWGSNNNEMMPFFIVRDFTEKIKNQLDFEGKEEIYNYVQQKLKRKEIKNILNEIQEVSNDSVDVLMEFLLKKFRPKGTEEGMMPLHDLSKEDLERVNVMISKIEEFDIEAMVELVKKRKAAADRTMEINRILKSAMADEDARKFVEKENSLFKRQNEISTQIHASEIHLIEMKKKMEIVVQQRDRALQKIGDSAQNKHVFKLSKGLSKIMENVLKNKSESIKRNLEKLIVENLQCIYRKDNLITHIEVEDDFQFNLYQNVKYSNIELIHLIKNLGKEKFASEVGKRGMERLLERYKVKTVSQLQKALEMDTVRNSHSLFKRIDINRLSKGERQIFILSLYWAIIELSGQDIPFVIDTPYARIDANHRKEISEKFFPNISKQVIILSTDEEINEEYYEIIKPHIAKEYLLINDESQNRTTVEQRYFFEV